MNLEKISAILLISLVIFCGYKLLCDPIYKKMFSTRYTYFVSYTSYDNRFFFGGTTTIITSDEIDSEEDINKISKAINSLDPNKKASSIIISNFILLGMKRKWITNTYVEDKYWFSEKNRVVL